ncbi:LLM class F420-dependent oxidoreductase [Kribbella sandramycini]|uniref:LLM class F420-dependent oxidoreductase n=1 Tax=Kribbella sandramycini TaxID=60450 RepID=A0A7Y4L2E9_9ACTN|nr:LLM class F420-dependent oxidoreductase [Kribbella sandramycini]MBB6566226.1 putative F420-dependent oxidoreductase [Kribbella sandramycini]NOL43108.1 LLM class F420-dependent oxidoreductase [Kribbella sandramycini]
MRIGAVFPQLEIGSDPQVVREWARTVEDAGYTHALAYDHVLGADPAQRPGWTGYTDKSLFHEVFVLFGYLAAITTELELVTGVLVLPQRQTALVAKQAAEVDLLSGGRLRLGVGIGWNHVEYDALGVPFAKRGARLTEQVELLRKLWAEPVITHDGRFDRVEQAGLNPLPGRQIPIWFGGTADAVLRRTGAIGDGWMPQGPPDDRMRAQVATVREAAAAAGRTVGFEARLTLAQVPESEWRVYVDGWRELGATHLCVNTMGLGLADPADHARVLSEVLPKLG